MTTAAPPPWRHSGGGADALRSTIIASATTDCGASLMCADCGHEFLKSIPLSDESEPAYNDKLARDLYYHMCALGRRAQPRSKRVRR